MEFNVAVKNLGSISDWMKNTLTEKDTTKMVNEYGENPENFDISSDGEKKLMSDFDVKDIATSICKANNLSNDHISNISRELIKQLKNEKFPILIKLYKEAPTSITLNDLGIKNMELAGKTVDIGGITVNPKLLDTVLEHLLANRYEKIQNIASKNLIESGDVFLLCEFNTKIPKGTKEIMQFRPETKAIATSREYEPCYLTTREKPDCVIAIPTDKFTKIENKSFNASGSDVACAVATHANSNRQCMFISAHVSGFHKEQYSKAKTKEDQDAHTGAGDVQLKKIAEKVKEFRTANPDGVVVFGGDLNTSFELYAGRHDMLKDAGLPVQGSGKATNIQHGDENTATELDFVGVSHLNAMTGKKIAELKIEEDKTADKFDAFQESSDHKMVVAKIKIEAAAPSEIKENSAQIEQQSQSSKNKQTSSSKETSKVKENKLKTDSGDVKELSAGTTSAKVKSGTSLLKKIELKANQVLASISSRWAKSRSSRSSSVSSKNESTQGEKTVTFSDHITSVGTHELPPPQKPIISDGEKLALHASLTAQISTSDMPTLPPLPTASKDKAPETLEPSIDKTSKTKIKSKDTKKASKSESVEKKEFPASDLPKISFYGKNDRKERNDHIKKTIDFAVDNILDGNDRPSQVIMGIANQFISHTKTHKLSEDSPQEDVEARLLRDKYLIGLCSELVSNEDWLSRCTAEDKKEIKGLVDLVINEHKGTVSYLKYDNASRDQEKILEDMIKLKNEIDNVNR